MTFANLIPKEGATDNEKIDFGVQTDFNLHLLPMPQNNYNQSQQEFKQFRDKLYQSFNYRRDTVMDLVDAIAANTTARTPVELSLSSLFRREYSALYKGIQEMRRTNQTDSTEAIKSQNAQIEARTLSIAELIPTPRAKAILRFGQLM